MNENIQLYFEKRERFRKLTIEEQLNELENSNSKVDAVIGEIYIKETLFLKLTDRLGNIEILSNLLNNAKCIKDYGIGGMGDVECRWLFAKNNLLIGVCATSFYGGPLLVAGGYKVYRFSNQQQLNLNFENIEHLLF